MTKRSGDLLLLSDRAQVNHPANADNIPKFAMALSSLGNLRTRTARAWSEAEMTKFISELP
jgi:uncharacterized protein with GYD domain